MESFPDRFVLLKRPERNFIGWYKSISEKYGIEPYVRIENPDPYVMQSRYQADNGAEMIYIIHSHLHKSHQTKITFSDSITRNRQGWIWDPSDGSRYRISLEKDNSISLDLGPADSFMFVFDRNRRGPVWKPLPTGNPSQMSIPTAGWRNSGTAGTDR